MRLPFILAFIISIIFTDLLFSQQESRLLRFPAIYGNQVVFTYAGDLYTVARTGGTARKLTTHKGFEMFARFSPDGKQIAFTGQYDGNTEVFLIPAEGGAPKRLTYTATLKRDDISDRMGPNNIVMTWTKDSKNVIYRSRKQSFNDFMGQLFSVPAEGGLSQELPLPAGGFCSYSADGKKLAYNRVFREFRTWKYYKGGMADDIWIYDFDTKKTENLTNNTAQDIVPMWFGDEIYFISDRDRTMNLFVYNIKTKETKKVTAFTEYDIKFPSPGNDAIVFENAGYIYIFDIKTQKYDKINVSIEDDLLTGRDELKDASKNINTVEVAPDGNRLVIGARGDIYTLPAKSGITRNLTQTSGVHERNPTWSPDGKFIAYISDQSGEYEIYIVKQDGSEKPIQLTKNADTYKYSLKWSPDCKMILWSDKKMRLQYVNVETKEVVQVDKSEVWEFGDFNWSPDGRWITYSRTEKNKMKMIWLYDVVAKKNYPVTQDWYDSSGPSFSANGKFLFFASKRDFNPVYSETEWNHSYSDMERVYFVTLAKATKSPLAPDNDEVGINKPESKEPDKNSTQPIVKPIMAVDIDGIGDRIVALPIKPASYWGIHAVEDRVFYIKIASGDEKSSLAVFNLKEKKETELGNFDSFDISAEMKKMMLAKEGKYYIIDLPKDDKKDSLKPDDLKEAVSLSEMKVWVNNKQEWKQIFDESWRQMRDFFYDPNMHGVNWKAMHDKYAVLVPFVNNRNDLNYLIGELIGELNIGHAYTGGGDKPAPDRLSTGLLGAKITRDASGYFKIDKILKGQNWDKTLRSPLTEVGVDVKEGDFIIAVNGKSLKETTDIYKLLVNTAGKTIELTVNSIADEKGSRKTLVVPVDDESLLYYFNWVQSNIEKVSKATNNEVGYIHIPEMLTEGLNEFVKYFYPQLTKKALIIDDRGNGGGNVSPQIVERLRREISLVGMSRDVPQGNSVPEQMMLGPKVLLMNNYSASDGDLFPYQFKKHKLGKVIGLRSWGGVVGIRGSLPFVDGGFLTRPEFGHYAADGSGWIIEGYGVDPDIVVDNDPAKEYAGEDQQLNKAIDVILEDLKTQKKEVPPIPPFPDKSK